MKKIIILFVLLPFICTMVGCEQEMMDFEEESSIYFDVRYGNEWRDSSFWARHYYTPLNFIDKVGDTVEITLPVAIAGPVVDYPRSFKVEVIRDSSTAQEGLDFDFKRDWVLDGGKTVGYVKLQVYRHDYLEDTLRTIVLRVQDNEYFTTRLDFDQDLSGRDKLLEEDKKYNSDPRFHTVEISLSVQKPTDWWGYDYPDYQREMDVFGAYTSRKYLLMLKVLNFTEEQFCDLIKSKDRARVAGEIFANYLTEQFDNGTPVLEKDGRLMWVQAVKKWIYYQYEW
ncbi:MAG: DUF4843 domain-containing protein [Odoribacter splanchnicus]